MPILYLLHMLIARRFDENLSRTCAERSPRRGAGILVCKQVPWENIRRLLLKIEHLAGVGVGKV